MGEKPNSLLSAYLWRQLLQLRDLVRWPEWYNSKLPVFLVAMFYAVLRLDAPGAAEAVPMAALFVLFCLYAAFGHIVNDYADREVDRIAGKRRILLHWSEPAALSAVAIPAAGTIGIALAFFDAYTSALAILAVLLAAFYSLPPVRLKERGIFGWAGAVVTQRTLPVVIGVQAFEAWDASTVLLCVLNTLIGLRFIILHQIDDRQNDRRAGVRTVATEQSMDRMRAQLYMLFYFEIACAWAAVAAMSYYAPAVGVTALAYAIGLFDWYRRGNPITPLSYRMLSVFYCVIWPIVLALLLALRDPIYLPAVLAAAAISSPRLRYREWMNGLHLPSKPSTPPSTPSPPQPPAEGPLQRAKALMQAGRWAEARQAFFAALRNAPGDFDILNCYGECAFLSGDKEEAAKVFRHALELQPNSCRALCNLGSVYRVSGRHGDAIACFEKAMESDPDFQPTYINFAVALHETFRPREALALLERALNKWPQLQMAADVHRRIAAELSASRPS